MEISGNSSDYNVFKFMQGSGRENTPAGEEERY